MASLTKAQVAYIDKFGAFGGELGVPRSVARVLGLLLVCQPPEQSSQAIQHQLGLSSGSVSAATTLLVRARLIECVHFQGDRQFYFRLDPAGWRRAFYNRLGAIRAMRELAEEGLALDGANQRVAEMGKVYAWAETEFAELAKKLERL